ncbi:MAG: CBS domain-containing protein, partial [Chloroflexi bacterium]
MPTLSRVLQPIGPTCPADVSAADALKRLTASGADALLVVKSGTFVGLFGHREALAAFADGSGPVEQYMRRPLPGRNVADSLESGADIMYREDTPIVLMTEDEGPLF